MKPLRGKLMGPQSRPVEFNSSECPPRHRRRSRSGRYGGVVCGYRRAPFPRGERHDRSSGSQKARGKVAGTFDGLSGPPSFPCYSPRCSEACRRTEESHAAASASPPVVGPRPLRGSDGFNPPDRGRRGPPRRVAGSRMDCSQCVPTAGSLGCGCAPVIEKLRVRGESIGTPSDPS